MVLGLSMGASPRAGETGFNSRGLRFQGRACHRGGHEKEKEQEEKLLCYTSLEIGGTGMA